MNMQMEVEQNHQVIMKTKKVNPPQLLTGMTPIKFKMPTESEIGQTVTTVIDDESWYEYGETYEARKWENEKT